MLLTILSAVAFSCSGPKEKEYILFHGGTILTVDEDFSEVKALVVEDQRIIATGNYDDLKADYGDRAELIDLEGRTMLPGFIDAHSHAVSGALVNNLMDYVCMSRYKNTDEVLNHFEQKVLETPEGEWITGRNWDPAVQDGPEELTIATLDSISTKHP